MGLSTVFLFWLYRLIFGQFFLQNQVLLSRISGVVIILFGLHFLGVYRIPILDHEARLDAGIAVGRLWGPMCWVWPLPLVGHPSGRSLA